MLQVEGLSAWYGKVQVLWDVSLEIKSGELVGLLGANGAGKTTLLKSIVNLVSTRKGRILYQDKDITKVPPHLMTSIGIAYVPEGRGIFPAMTVFENLRLGALAPAASQRWRETLEFVYTIFPRLRERANQLAGTLSGGEQQMLAIGRGLMACPKLLLMDEPSLGIAPILVQEIFNQIKRINQQGVSVLLVEQHITQVLKICHRAYVLENGRIVLSGKSLDLLNNPGLKEAYLGM